VSEKQVVDDRTDSIKLTLTVRLGLQDMQSQKRALSLILFRADLRDQHETAEGLLSLLDYLQDAIVDQGLATEEEVFGPDYGKDSCDDED